MNWPTQLSPLATQGWLADTPESFRAAVLSRSVVKTFARNDVVYRAGDPPGGLYGLIDGAVGVEVGGENRSPQLALLFRPGFWIGEGSVLARRPRAVGVRCTRDSRLAYLSLTHWDAIVRADPEAWRWFAWLMLRNELLAVSVAETLLVRRASSRVAGILVLLAAANEAHREAAAVVRVEIAHEQLALMSNLSRSSLERILRAFAGIGLVQYGYRHVLILDLEGLKAHRTSADE